MLPGAGGLIRTPDLTKTIAGLFDVPLEGGDGRSLLQGDRAPRDVAALSRPAADGHRWLLAVVDTGQAARAFNIHKEGDGSMAHLNGQWIVPSRLPDDPTAAEIKVAKRWIRAFGLRPSDVHPRFR